MPAVYEAAAIPSVQIVQPPVMMVPVMMGAYAPGPPMMPAPAPVAARGAMMAPAPMHRPVVAIDTEDDGQPPPPMYTPAGTGRTPQSSAEMPPLERTVAAEAAAVPLPLRRVVSERPGFQRIMWAVDAKKLTGKDTQVVSGAFDLPMGARQEKKTFKMMVKAEVTGQERGGASFKKAKGRGSIHLKCESPQIDPDNEVAFKISVHAGSTSLEARPASMPVAHNFANNATAGLSAADQVWDFKELVKAAHASHFVVTLQIVPTATA